MAAVTKNAQGIDYVSHINGEKIPLSLKIIRNTIKIGSYIAPPITLRFLEKLWYTPKRVKLNQEQLKFYEDGNSYFLDYNGVDVFVHEKGEGKPLLLVHGWGSSSYHFRLLSSELIAKGFKVVMFDAPGNSQSKGKRTNGLEVAEIIESLHEKYNFYGVVTHSFGGFATLIARSRGLSIEKLATVAMPTRFDSIFGPFIELLQVPDEMFEKMMDRFEKRFNRDIHSIAPINLELEVPEMLLVHDKHDNVIPFNDALNFQNKHSSTDIFLTENLGHRKVLKDNEVIHKITEFLTN